MAWAAGLASYDDDLEELVKKYSSRFKVLNYDSSMPYYLYVKVIKGRKYSIKVGSYDRADGSNVLIKVFGPYKTIVDKVLIDFERKIGIHTREPTPELVFMFGLIDSMKKHKVNGKKESL